MTAELRELLDQVPPEEIPEIIAALAVRMVTKNKGGAGHPHGDSPVAPPSGDNLLTRKQAATKLSVASSWLSRRKGRLPFEVPLGDRTPRYSSLGIDRYISQRKRGG